MDDLHCDRRDLLDVVDGRMKASTQVFTMLAFVVIVSFAREYIGESGHDEALMPMVLACWLTLKIMDHIDDSP